MKRIFIVLFIFLAVILIKPLFVFAQALSASNTTSGEIEELNKKINEKRKKIQQLEDSIVQVKKDIDKKRLEATSLKNQIAILDNRATQIELDIEAAEERLASLNMEIQALELKIKLKEETIAKQKEMLAEFIRTINYENDKSYLEVLAVYDNFSDFYNRLQYLHTVEENLGQSAKSLRLTKVDLEEKKNQTVDRKNVYEGMKKELEEKKQDYNEQIFNKENLLFQTKSTESVFQTLLSNLRKQYQEIEQEIAKTEREVRERLEAQERLDNVKDTAFGGLFSWPTQSRYITTGFHDPEYPFRNIFEHNAIDIRANHGTAIKAAASGYVARAKVCSVASCYSYIMLVHANGFATIYGHMSKISVQEDQFVTRGDVIGLSGGTPGSSGAGPFVTGPHLHFEIRKNGIPIDPLGYLRAD